MSPRNKIKIRKWENILSFPCLLLNASKDFCLAFAASVQCYRENLRWEAEKCNRLDPIPYKLTWSSHYMGVVYVEMEPLVPNYLSEILQVRP